jgi:hypothetical protein
MSLDFDRSPDGEPLPPATQQPVPVQQAPATADEERTLSPSFTPKHAAGEPADDELADEPVTGEHEPAADEPGPTAYEPTASRPVVPGSVVSESMVDEPGTAGPPDDELTDRELADDELADDELPDDMLPPAEPVLADPAEADEPVPVAATASEATAYHSSVAPAWDAAAGLDGPLLTDTDELHASWQRVQGAFIDDPREAVADAAGLVEHVGQLLAGALRQRQQQLRAMWDSDGMPDGVDYADSGSPAGTVSSGADRPAADGGPDTEQLRLLIRRYRALFNELCP